MTDPQVTERLEAYFAEQASIRAKQAAQFKLREANGDLDLAQYRLRNAKFLRNYRIFAFVMGLLIIGVAGWIIREHAANTPTPWTLMIGGVVLMIVSVHSHYTRGNLTVKACSEEVHASKARLSEVERFVHELENQ